ncbi:hypothetical protein G8O24_01255 [Bradyrhizobium sp. INPA01-394B]|uniref:Uncharacterized protein n=1 Tax=Bradyrhizobium campsiandrae TaxID=1729892 RepID=A0ABR7U0E8_9BRAD|nr:hypothetical protein [Bradyrhizobium campsiandrae]MBC9875972.1 hypothetical protein [Bradyrhizobium campsiandrae]MBC9976919.1 hypothetical protein [Bradyrhizobium campsiandrae]
MSNRFQPLDKLPLFAEEEAISVALLGPGKYAHWRQLAPLLEGRGFPKIDAEMGGRYTPAIKRFFDHEYRLDTAQPVASRDGPEDWGTWKKKSARRA